MAAMGNITTMAQRAQYNNTRRKTPNVANVIIKNRVCAHPTELERPADWKHATFNKKNVTDKNIICKHQTYIKAFDIPRTNKRDAIVFSSCLGNEEVGMYNRYFKETPKMSLDMDTFEIVILEMLGHLKSAKKITTTQFLETKHGGLGKRYRELADSLLVSGLDLNKDTTVSPFIKSEKYFVDGKPPRLIYPRNPKFNILYAQYILPIEHELTKLPQVAKGKNFAARGQAFQSLVYGEWYGENDMSKFESSQRPELYDLVQKRIFDQLYPGDTQLQMLYESKMHKRGYTKGGAKWSAYGMMASGEMDTGCFNTIFNWLACRYFEVKNGYGNGNFIVDGDDSVLRIPRDSNPLNTFTDFGFDAKFFIKHDYHDVEFCSSKFIQYQPSKFIQVQDINKIFDSVPVMLNKSFEEYLGDYYASLGKMYSVLYKNIPVLEDFGEFLMTASDSAVNMKLIENTGAARIFKLEQQDIETDYRSCLVELSMCFSVDIEELLTIRDYFRQHHLNFHSKPYRSRDRKLKQIATHDMYDAIRLTGKVRPRPS